MSVSFNRRKKERRQARSVDEKALDRRIKKGELPRFALQLGQNKLPRAPHGKSGRRALAWKQLSVKSILLDRIV